MNKKVTDLISAVNAFKGETAEKSIEAYRKNPFTMSKTEIPYVDSPYDALDTFKTTYEAPITKKIYSSDVRMLPNILEIQKAGLIDCIHAFLFVTDSFDMPMGIYAIHRKGVFKFKDLDRETYRRIAGDMEEGGGNMIVICAELNLKTDAYKEAGYDIVMLEAGAIVQNLFRLLPKQPELYGNVNPFQLIPYHFIDKEEAIKELGFTQNNFIICTSILIG